VQYLKKKPTEAPEKPDAEGKPEGEGKPPEGKTTESKPATNDPNAPPSPPKK
jgi:hypothetical protein